MLHFQVVYVSSARGSLLGNPCSRKMSSLIDVSSADHCHPRADILQTRYLQVAKMFHVDMWERFSETGKQRIHLREGGWVCVIVVPSIYTSLLI